MKGIFGGIVTLGTLAFMGGIVDITIRKKHPDLFRRQKDSPGLSRARALQQTMSALIDGPGFVDPKTNKVVFSYAHPIFWAPFTLVGDGGGN